MVTGVRGNRIIIEVVPQRSVTFVARAPRERRKDNFSNCPCGKNSIQVYLVFFELFLLKELTKCSQAAYNELAPVIGIINNVCKVKTDIK